MAHKKESIRQNWGYFNSLTQARKLTLRLTTEEEVGGRQGGKEEEDEKEGREERGRRERGESKEGRWSGEGEVESVDNTIKGEKPIIYHRGDSKICSPQPDVKTPLLKTKPTQFIKLGQV